MSSIRGGAAVSAAYSQAMAAVPGRVSAIVSEHGTLLETRVKANASGRPGPRAITGNYRRSISGRTSSTDASSTAVVGTNAPQANRLEHGFHGVDASGRAYDDPPRPHFLPAFQTTAPAFIAALRTYANQLGKVRS